MATDPKRAPKEEPPLEEKNFIQEKFKQDPFPLWASILLFLLVALAIYLFSTWMDRTVEEEKHHPSVEATNPAS